MNTEKNHDNFILLENLSKLKDHNNKQNHFFMFLDFLKEIFSPQKIITYHWNGRIKIHPLREVSIFHND